MFRTLIYWALMGRFFLYITFNLKRLEKAYKRNDLEKVRKLTSTSHQIYSQAIFKSSNAKIDVSGLEKINLDETYLLVSNHLSLVDISAIIKAFPKYVTFASKSELSSVFVFGDWMRLCGSVFLDRENPRETITSFNKAIENLKNGISMCIFPEGTRSITGEIGKFKRGSFKLAIKSNVKILPVVLHGTREIYENNCKRIKKGTVKVIFLDPIDVSKLSKDEIKNINDVVRDNINSVYEKLS